MIFDIHTQLNSISYIFFHLIFRNIETCSATKVVARDLRRLLQKVPASYILQALLQLDEHISSWKIREELSQ